MASLNSAKIRKIIELTLKVDPSSKEGADLINQTIARLKALSAQNATLANDARLLANAAREQARLVKAQNMGLLALAQSTNTAGKSTLRLTEHFGKLAATIKGITPLAGVDILEGFAFEKAIKFITDFNKSLIMVSSQFSKYGVGAATVEKRLQTLSVATTLTRKDTMSLLAAYEKGFNYTSLDRGAKLLMNLKNAVGANVDAMKEMKDFLSGIVQKFPDLEDSITRLNSFDKERLILQSRLLAVTGQISFADSKRLRDYAYQNAQATSEDEKRLNTAKDEIEAINKLYGAVERIANIVGNKLTPYVVKLADFIDGTKYSWEKWITPLTKIGLIMAGIEGTMLAIRGVKWLGNLAGVPKLFGAQSGASGGFVGNVKNFLTPNWGGGIQRGMQAGAMPGWRDWLNRSASQPLTLKRAGSIGLDAAKGGAAAWGAGKIYDESYEFATGRKLLDDTSAMGTGHRAGKIGTMAGTGLAFGGLPGMAMGAGVGLAEEGASTYTYVNKLRAESLHLEQEGLIKLTKEAQRFKEAADNAKSPDAQNYADKKAEANRIRGEASKYIQKHENTGSFLHHLFSRTTSGFDSSFNEGNGLSKDQQTKYQGMLAKANALDRDAAKNPWFQQQVGDEEARNKRNAEADANRPKTEGDKADILSQYSIARTSSAPDALAAFYKETFSNIQKKMDAVIVPNVLSLPEGIKEDNADIAPIKHLINGAPIQSDSKDMQKIGFVNDEAVRKMALLASEGKEVTDEYKQQKAIADATGKQLDQWHKSTIGVRSEFEILGAKMNEARSTAEQGLKTFEAQKNVLSAMVEKQFLLGQSGFNAENQAQVKDMVESYKTAAVLNRQLLSIDQQITEETAKKSAQQKELLMEELGEESNKSSPNTAKIGDIKDQIAKLDLAAARFATVMSLGKIQAEQQIKLVDINNLKESVAIYFIQLAKEEKFIEVSKTHTGQLQSQLQLQMQYGNSVAESVQTSSELIKINQTTYDQLAKELALVQDEIKLNGINPEYAQKEYNILTQMNQVRSEGLQILQNTANLNKTNVDYAMAQADQIESMIALQDNLAMGVQASAATRMKAAESIGQVIKEEQVNVDNLKASISAGLPAMKSQVQAENPTITNPAEIERIANDRLLSTKTLLVQKNTTILQLMQKQAALTKSIRDGWVSAIQSMTAGTGMFAKLMISQEKNLGVGVTYIKGFVQSMKSGGVDLTGQRSVGQRQSSKFGIGGIEGQYDPSRRYETYDGGDQIKGKVGATQEQMKKFLQSHNDRITSQSAAAFGAAPQQGAILKSSMTTGANNTSITPATQSPPSKLGDVGVEVGAMDGKPRSVVSAPISTASIIPAQPVDLSKNDKSLTTISKNDSPEMKLWKLIAQKTALSELHLRSIETKISRNTSRAIEGTKLATSSTTVLPTATNTTQSAPVIPPAPAVNAISPTAPVVKAAPVAISPQIAAPTNGAAAPISPLGPALPLPAKSPVEETENVLKRAEDALKAYKTKQLKSIEEDATAEERKKYPMKANEHNGFYGYLNEKMGIKPPTTENPITGERESKYVNWKKFNAENTPEKQSLTEKLQQAQSAYQKAYASQFDKNGAMKSGLAPQPTPIEPMAKTFIGPMAPASIVKPGESAPNKTAGSYNVQDEIRKVTSYIQMRGSDPEKRKEILGLMNSLSEHAANPSKNKGIIGEELKHAAEYVSMRGRDPGQKKETLDRINNLQVKLDGQSDAEHEKMRISRQERYAASKHLTLPKPIAKHSATSVVSQLASDLVPGKQSGGLINGKPSQQWLDEHKAKGSSEDIEHLRKIHEASQKKTPEGGLIDGKSSHAKPMSANSGSSGNNNIHFNFPINISDSISQLTAQFNAAINEVKRSFRGEGLDSSSTGGSRFT